MKPLSSSGMLFLLVLCSLATTISSQDVWQAMGNFTADNITFINSTIAAAMSSSMPPTAIAINISTTLNKKWDPAWNVAHLQRDVGRVTVGSFSDVVYGYAYNNHWLWYNKYSNKTDGPKSTTTTFIIWKDYNCDTWFEITEYDATMQTQHQTAISNAITTIATNETLASDPWNFIFKVNNKIAELYPTEAYTIIAIPAYENIAARVCTKAIDGVSQSFTTNSFFSTAPTFAVSVFRMR